jgi:hypothetical protein
VTDKFISKSSGLSLQESLETGMKR